MLNFLHFLHIFAATPLKLPANINNNFAKLQVDKYNFHPSSVYTSENIYDVASINNKYDFMLFNNTQLSSISNTQLDDLFINAQSKLNNLGMLLIDPIKNNTPPSTGYKLILDNPEELWNYNLVSVEIHGNKIFSRKGNSMISKHRQLRIINPNYNSFTPVVNLNNTTYKLKFISVRTGNEPFDYVVNMLGFLFQYMFLFNFFSFGIMMLIKTFIKM